jgi:hypothetical protein
MGHYLAGLQSSNGAIQDFEFDGPKIYLGGIFNRISMVKCEIGVAALDLSGNVIAIECKHYQCR